MAGEALEKSAGRWELCDEVMGDPFVPLSEEETLRWISDPGLLTAETNYPELLRQEREQRECDFERLHWIERVVEETLELIEKTGNDVNVELMMSSPGAGTPTTPTTKLTGWGGRLARSSA